MRILQAGDEIVAEIDALEIILHGGSSTIVAIRFVLAVILLLGLARARWNFAEEISYLVRIIMRELFIII